MVIDYLKCLNFRDEGENKMDKHMNIEEGKFLRIQIEKAKTRLAKIRKQEVRILKDMAKHQIGTPMRNECIYQTNFWAEKAERQKVIIEGLKSLLYFDMGI